MTDYSPILHIPQVSPSQSSKETTINDGTAILEAASNATKTYNTTGLTTTLVSYDDFTHYILHRFAGHTAPLTVWVPDTKRHFIVSNEGSGAITVKPNGSASGSAVVPVGKIVLLQTDGDTIFALSSGVSRLQDLSDVDFLSSTPTDGLILAFNGSEGKWQATPSSDLGGAENFLELTDTPADYTGDALKVVRVKGSEDGLEFITLPLIPTTLGQLSDVEEATGKTAGDFLRWIDGVWQPDPGVAATNFLTLSDTPDSYTGQAGKLVRVKASADGVEFVTPPTIPVYLGDLANVELATGANDGDVLKFRDSVWQAEPDAGGGGGGGGGLTAEQVMDLVASFIVAGDNIDVDYDDAGDTLTISTAGTFLTPSYKTVVKPDSADFTLLQTTGSSGTLTDTTRGMVFTNTAPLASNDYNMLAQQALSAGDFTLDVKVVYTGPWHNYMTYGLFIKDNASGRIESFTLGYSSGNANRKLRLTDINTFSTGNETLSSYEQRHGGRPFPEIREGVNKRLVFEIDDEQATA